MPFRCWNFSTIWISSTEETSKQFQRKHCKNVVKKNVKCAAKMYMYKSMRYCTFSVHKNVHTFHSSVASIPPSHSKITVNLIYGAIATLNTTAGGSKDEVSKISDRGRFLCLEIVFCEGFGGKATASEQFKCVITAFRGVKFYNFIMWKHKTLVPCRIRSKSENSFPFSEMKLETKRNDFSERGAGVCVCVCKCEYENHLRS